MQSTGQDAFAYYSNDAARLKALLLKNDVDDFDLRGFMNRNFGTGQVNDKVCSTQQDEGDSNKQCNPQDDACKRKTRISFELHPTLLLDDLLNTAEDDEDLDDDDDDDILSVLETLRR